MKVRMNIVLVLKYATAWYENIGEQRLPADARGYLPRIWFEGSGDLKDDDSKALLIGSCLRCVALLCNSVYYSIIVYIKSCSIDPMVTF